MRPVLVLGCSHSELGLVTALKDEGCEIVTIGSDPRGLSHRLATRKYVEDYSDHDVVEKIAKIERPALIIPGANDFAAITASTVSKRIGLAAGDSPDLTRLFHTKDGFREIAAETGLPVPKRFDPSGPDRASVPYPVIVKPVDMTGGKGVSVARSAGELEAALRQAESSGRSGRVVVDQFVSGTSHGATFLINAGEVIFAFFDDEHYAAGAFAVAAASSPSSLTKETRLAVHTAVSDLAQAKEISDGIIHFQLISAGEDWFIFDVCRRIPGDLYTEFVSRATGTDYVRDYVRILLGRPVLGHPLPVSDDLFVSRVCLHAPRSGRLGVLRPATQGASRGSSLALTQFVDPGQLVSDDQKVAIGFISQSLRAPVPTLSDMTDMFEIPVTGGVRGAS